MNLKKVRVKQHGITDCGAACLASVSAHYDLHLPLVRIRQYASTDKKGTNVLGMVEAAEKLGFEAKGVRGVLDSLTKIPLPAIAHVVVKEVLQHYVVIYKVSNTDVVYMDPRDGKIHKEAIAEFEKKWTGYWYCCYPPNSLLHSNKKCLLLAGYGH